MLSVGHQSGLAAQDLVKALTDSEFSLSNLEQLLVDYSRISDDEVPQLLSATHLHELSLFSSTNSNFSEENWEKVDAVFTNFVGWVMRSGYINT